MSNSDGKNKYMTVVVSCLFGAFIASVFFTLIFPRLENRETVDVSGEDKSSSSAETSAMQAIDTKNAQADIAPIHAANKTHVLVTLNTGVKESALHVLNKRFGAKIRNQMAAKQTYLIQMPNTKNRSAQYIKAAKEVASTAKPYSIQLPEGRSQNAPFIANVRYEKSSDLDRLTDYGPWTNNTKNKTLRIKMNANTFWAITTDGQIVEVDQAATSELPNEAESNGTETQVPAQETGFAPDPATEYVLTAASRGVGPVAHWTLDDAAGTTATDSAGSNHGALTNGPVWSSGNVNGGLTFDGDNDFVQVGTVDADHPLLLAGTNATLTAWINPTSGGDIWQRIIDKSDGSYAANGYCLAFDRRSIHISVDGSDFVSTSNIVNYGEWTHVAGIITASGYKIYINGILDSGARLVRQSFRTAPAATANLRLGTWTHSTGREFKGIMDDVRIYNYELTATEIAALADNNPNQPPVAVAGNDQAVTTGNNVQLDGSGSSDPDNDPLTFSWAFTSRPAGSNATLSGATTSQPSFTADVDGSYVVQLTVNDGTDSDNDSVTVTATPPAGGDLIAHWKLDDASGTTAMDSAGSNHGTLLNGPVWGTGHLNGGLNFDGDNDIVEIGTAGTGHPLQLAGSDVTITAWINRTSGGDTWQRIVDKSNGSYAANGYCLASDNRLIHISVNGSDYVSSGNIINYGEWTHVAGVISASGFKIYVNGVQDTDARLARGTFQTPPSTSANFRLGSWTHSTGREFKGSMDDVRIYSRELSASEIATLANETGGGDTEGPIISVNSVVLKGTATDDNSTPTVTVNGQGTPVDGNDNWSHEVPTPNTTTQADIEAVDGEGNTTQETVTIDK